MAGYHPEQTQRGFETRTHDVDVCVVGGGLAGICAAIAAAREGARVLIMQDRPMFGGNASSEIRMWVCGAHGENKRETGIVEELELENIYRNPSKNYSLWDSVLYEKVRSEKNLTALLNCSCLDAQMDGVSIASVTGWQMSTQQYHRVNARIFIDCSGDSVLAPLTGALYRVGREARDEFDEDIEPERADETVMGMSILLQARETAEPTKFIPPAWAYKFPEQSQIPFRETHPKDSNYWWIETGGLGDTIGSTEEFRDELLKIAYGVWDHVKNGDPGYDASYRELDWVGFLPGKRESRRYVGDYMINQRDVRAGGPFEDVVAYAG
ncbi:MAG TPA: FAD-dependent oxidoreductase, partial [Capsulimonadaceae bacterium]|nr:FAD-dependent oxidoreductase [Capsulimonadaceae bacterium]